MNNKQIKSANTRNLNMNSNRTTMDVQKALSKTQTKPRTKTFKQPRKLQAKPRKFTDRQFLDLAYAKCRLDPFNAPGSGMIPDGSGKRIMVDHRKFIDFTVTTNGNMNIVVIPNLPVSVAFKPGDGTPFTIEGASVTQTPGTDLNANWVPCTSYAEYSPNSPGTTSKGPFNAAKGRIVTQAYRLTCTDSPLNMKGTLTAATYPTDASAMMPHGNYITQINSSSGVASSGLVFAASATGIFETPINLGDFSSNFGVNSGVTSDIVTSRPELGLCGLLKRQTPTNMWREYYENPTILYNGSFITAATLPSFVCTSFLTQSPFGTNYPSTSLYDDSFQPQFIQIRGAAASAPYRLEVITCVEYTVNSASPVARFAKDAPPANQHTIDVVDAVVNKAPIAVPNSETSSWWRTLLKSINLGAKAVSVLPNPYAAAGGSIASAMTSMFI